MYGVGIVGGNHQRALHQGRVGALAAGQAFEQGTEHGTLGAGGGQAAHLLVVIAHQQAAGGGVALQQRLQADKAAEQVVQPRGGDELLLQSHQCRGLGIVETQFVIQHLLHLAIRMLFQQAGFQHAAQIRAVALAGLAEYGQDIGLGIDLAGVVGLPVQVYGQAGNHRQGAAIVDQCGAQAAINGLETDPARQGQVAIEPRIEQRAAVNLDTQLQISVAQFLRRGLGHQAGAVGMRPHHAHAGDRWRFAPAHKGDQGTVVAGHEIVSPGLGVGPGFQLRESRFPQLPDHLRHGVERCGGPAQKCAEFAIELFLVHSHSMIR